MAVHRVRGSDGNIHRVEAPLDASPESIIAVVEQNLAGNNNQQGFGNSFAEGFKTIGALPGAIGFGLTNDDGARQDLVAAQQSEGARTSWEEVNDVPSFWDWAKQTAGQSMGYIAAPGVAGTAAKLLTKAPGVGRAVGMGVLGAQYLTDNMGRQAAEDSPANLGKAALAAVGQTGLDVVGMRFFSPLFKRMPVVNALMNGDDKAAGALVDAFSKKSLTFSEGIARGVGAGVAFEIPQEIAQQALERWNAGLSLTDEDARREYGEAAAGAALLGGTMGGLSGVADTRDAKREKAQGERDLLTSMKQREEETRKAAKEAEMNSKITRSAAVPTREEAAAEDQIEFDKTFGTATVSVSKPVAKPGAAATEEKKIPITDVMPRMWAVADEENKVHYQTARKVLLDNYGLNDQEIDQFFTNLDKGYATLNNKRTKLKLNERTKPAKPNTVDLKISEQDLTTALAADGLTVDGDNVVDGAGLPQSSLGEYVARVLAKRKPTNEAGVVTDTSGSVSNPAQPNTRGVVSGDEVPAGAGSADQAAVDKSKSAGVADGQPSVGEPDAGEGQNRSPLENFDRSREGPQGIFLTDEERAALESGRNLVASWQLQQTNTPDSTAAEPAREVELTPDARRFLTRVDMARALVPEDREDAVLARNRLDLLNKNVRQGKGITTRDRQDVQKLFDTWKNPPAEKTVREEFEPAAADPTLREILESEDRGGQKVELTDRKGETVKRKHSSKLTQTLDHIIATDRKGVLAGLARTMKDVVEADTTEENVVDPEGVARVKRMRDTGNKLDKKDPYLDVQFKSENKDRPYVGGKRDYGFENFEKNFKVVTEGKETSDKDRVRVAKLKKNGKLGEYNPRTNTFYFTQEGMTPKTVMHEMLHAYTVKTLYLYQNDPNSLTSDQRDAVNQLYTVMRAAKIKLGNRFPVAFENVYEFVSYSMTEPQFQAQLKNLKVPPLYTRMLNKGKAGLTGAKQKAYAQSLWSWLTKSVARMLGYRTRSGSAAEYEGNALIELTEAVSDIMTTPKQIKTPRASGMAPPPVMYASKSGKRSSPMALPDFTADEVERANIERMVEKHDRTRTISDTVKYYVAPEGWENLIVRFQNDRRPLKLLQDMLDRAGKLIVSGDLMNNVYDALTLSTQKAHFAMAEFLQPSISAMNEAVRDFADANGVDVKTALGQLDALFTAEHEAERRHIKYLFNVPLEPTKQFSINLPGMDASPRTAAAHREHIYKLLTSSDTPASVWTQTSPTQLRLILENIVALHADQQGLSPMFKASSDMRVDPTLLDEQSDLYSVINYSPNTLADMRRRAKELRAKHGTQIDAVRQAMNATQEATIKLNKEANYWSEPVSRLTDFYGWQNYVPFKGKPEFDEDADGYTELFTRRTGGGYEFVENQESFGGRKSSAENVILQTQVDAAKSALRLGRKDVPVTIKNLIDTKIIRGKTAKNDKKGSEKKHIIKFEDRFKGLENEQMKGENKVFLYRDDGSIEILELSDDNHTRTLREAIRRSYREPAPILHFMNQITGAMGHMHTRYNPAFAPYNFVRDALTNAFTLSATFGGSQGAAYISRVAKMVAFGGMAKARKVGWLYANDRIPEIRALAKTDPFVKDILDYLETGGRVAYIQGVSSKGSLDAIQRDAGETSFQRSRNAFNKYADTWSDLFELTSRAAAYSTLKQKYMTENSLSEGDARIKAAADAKNLANFEQIGIRGREAGALFMFFRPAATGAVAAFDAIRPLLVSEKEYMRNLPEVIANDPAAIAKIKEEYKQHRKNARNTLAALFGAGMTLYMMAFLAGEWDDEKDQMERNKVATDDMALWTRNLRLPMSIFGSDQKGFLQIPWGFGLGAFASAGAQFAGWAQGRQSLKQMLGNTVTIGLDSLIPLPVSRINPTENGTAWFIDSIMPSVVRPLVEWSMNVDGIGREIYNDRVTKYGDSMLGGQNVPEAYVSAARYLSDLTNGDVAFQPNSIYFWVNNYVDGAARVASGLAGLNMVLGQQKDFDPKTDTLLLSSFVGRPGNIDAREFTAVENKLKEMKSRLQQYEGNPVQLTRYLKRYPDAPHLVDVYNKVLGGDLKTIRADANAIRADKSLTPRERKNLIELTNFASNIVKRQALDYFSGYGITP